MTRALFIRALASLVALAIGEAMLSEVMLSKVRAQTPARPAPATTLPLPPAAPIQNTGQTAPPQATEQTAPKQRGAEPDRRVERVPVDSRSKLTPAELAVVKKQQPPAGRIRVSPRMLEADPALEKADDDIVAITFRQDGRDQICTGVAVSGDAILTAGHCVCGDPATYRISIGGKTRPEAERLVVRALLPFPRYRCNSYDRPAGRDIALIRLVKPREDLETHVRAFTYAADTKDAQPSHLRVYGFGLTQDRSYGERRTAFVPVATFTCTERAWRRSGCAPFVEFVLAPGGADGSIEPNSRKDSCGGDSGGPVFQITDDRAYLVGLVSRGLPNRPRLNGLPCGSGGIYSTVGRHSVVNWLRREGVRVCLKDGPCEVNTAYRP